MWQRVKAGLKQEPSRTVRLILVGWVFGIGTAIIIVTWTDTDWLVWQKLLVSGLWILGGIVSLRNIPETKGV